MTKTENLNFRITAADKDRIETLRLRLVKHYESQRMFLKETISTADICRILINSGMEELEKELSDTEKEGKSENVRSKKTSTRSRVSKKPTKGKDDGTG